MSTGFDPIALANTVLAHCKASDIEASQMKLQKLVWLTHGFRLGFKDAPAINDVFEAWPYGPVCPTLYYATASCGSAPVDVVTDQYGRQPQVIGSGRDPSEIAEVVGLVEGIVGAYGKLTAIQLSNLTHLPGSPWSKVVKEVKDRHQREVRASDHEAIRNSMIEEYFKRWIETGTPPPA